MQGGPIYCHPRQDKIQPNSAELGLMTTYEERAGNVKVQLGGNTVLTLTVYEQEVIFPSQTL